MLTFMVVHQKLVEIESLKKKFFLINVPCRRKRVVRHFYKKKTIMSHKRGGKSRKIFSPMKRAYPNQYKNMFIFLKTILEHY